MKLDGVDEEEQKNDKGDEIQCWFAGKKKYQRTENNLLISSFMPVFFKHSQTSIGYSEEGTSAPHVVDLAI